jgi:hypothetical protein
MEANVMSSMFPKGAVVKIYVTTSGISILRTVFHISQGLHKIKFTRFTHLSLTTKQKRVSWDSALNSYVLLGNYTPFNITNEMRIPRDKIISSVLFGFSKNLHCHLSYEKKICQRTMKGTAKYKKKSPFFFTMKGDIEFQPPTLCRLIN